MNVIDGTDDKDGEDRGYLQGQGINELPMLKGKTASLLAAATNVKVQLIRYQFHHSLTEIRNGSVAAPTPKESKML